MKDFFDDAMLLQIFWWWLGLRLRLAPIFTYSPNHYCWCSAIKYTHLATSVYLHLPSTPPSPSVRINDGLRHCFPFASYIVYPASLRGNPDSLWWKHMLFWHEQWGFQYIAYGSATWKNYIAHGYAISWISKGADREAEWWFDTGNAAAIVIAEPFSPNNEQWASNKYYTAPSAEYNITSFLWDGVQTRLPKRDWIWWESWASHWDGCFLHGNIINLLHKNHAADGVIYVNSSSVAMPSPFQRCSASSLPRGRGVGRGRSFIPQWSQMQVTATTHNSITAFVKFFLENMPGGQGGLQEVLPPTLQECFPLHHTRVQRYISL